MPKLHPGDFPGYPSTLDRKVMRFILDMGIDLICTIWFTIFALASMYLPYIHVTDIRTILSMAIIMVLPGYSLVAALFPGKADISALERLVLSLGMSLILVSLIGLVLNFTPWGIRLFPVSVCISSVTIILALIANKRRFDLPGDDRFSVFPGKIGKAAAGRMFAGDHTVLDKALTVILLITLIASVSVIAFVVVFPKQAERFTEFYVLGTTGKAENYRTSYVLGDHGTFVVGIANHEQKEMTYCLIVMLDGNGTNSRLYSDHVTLADNQSTERLVFLKPDHVGTNVKMRFLLYNNTDIYTPYRECHIWVNVTAPGESKSP